MALDIIVVGAGIAGLCTAVALKRAGHVVKIFEKSSFAGEVGAALLITPNGKRVLSNLGFDFARARADPMTCFEVLDGLTFDPLNRTDLSNAQEDFGAPFYTVHRVDLHEELMRLTSGLEIRLATKVVGTNGDLTAVKLEDGSEHHADLIIAADGLHSVLRTAVLREEEAASHMKSRMRAFRFMIPTAQLQDDHGFRELVDRKGQGNSVLVDTSATTERHMVWYTCRNGQVQNFAGVYENSEPREDADVKKLMLEEFGHYHPGLRHIISKADGVTDWPLAYHNPLPYWQRGNIILIGDAAHPMLPFGAQGANQAIEDAGALAVVLSGDDTSPQNLMHRLAVFEKVRRLRASRVQIMSGVRLGKEKLVEDGIRRYADSTAFEAPSSISERYRHDYCFDVLAAAKAAMDV